MHRFQPGNENPILNDKLLREAYQAGRRQALNEVSGGDAGGGGDPFGGGGGTRPAIEVDNSPIPDVNVEYFMNQAAQGMPIPAWVIEWFQTNAPFLYGRLRNLIASGGRSVNMGGLREQAMPPSMQRADINYNTSATQFPGRGNRMGSGMGMKGRGMGMGVMSKGGIPKPTPAGGWPWGDSIYPPNGWIDGKGYQWRRDPDWNGTPPNGGWQRRYTNPPEGPPGNWRETSNPHSDVWDWT